MASARARTTRRLRPWLVEQIESGKCAGLKWHDEQKTCFKIPWKHAGKQDFRHDEDAAIFKAWAMYKKKYQDGEKADPASWKTRFRCALNKSPEFQELPEESRMDISEPFKVYRLVPPEEQGITPSEKQSRKRKSTTESRSSSSDETDPVEKKPQIVSLEFGGSEVTSSVSPEDSGIGSDTSNTDAPIQVQHIPDFESSSHNIDITNMNTIPTLDAQSYEAYKGLRVTLTYSGIEVAQKLIQSGECKLSARAPMERSLGGMEHVLLPAPGEQLPAETRSRTERLLTFLQSGVMLTSNSEGIFAQRQKACSGRIYWTGPYSESQGAINKLERDAFVQLFYTQKFLKDVETYKAEGGVPPEYHVTLCFGEEFSECHHTTDKLITAKIEQVLASEMVHQATESLCVTQISDSLMQNPSYLITLVPVTTLDNIPEFP
ncbi:hypothetical protein GDO78_007003 [Eleutherodactylus coqui]|uniref:IRF tryptophan pentad repeat domain-containing protein n=1 Tax=Eleutherodactylus coqui TaxID=57060 RepID=A0A8J6FH53_ELECQ|nr:hypothetical protein GDO78_007003 [Eleutherodactylus coqui]